MSLPDIDQHAIDSFRKFYALLPRSTDASLLILKLHLLVEEQVRAFIDERLVHREALENARLACHQAICLAEALSSEDIHANVWESARKLNSLRNHIAHQLEPEGVLARMNQICALIGLPLGTSSAQGKTPEQVALDDLSFAVSLLHGELSIHVKKKLVAVPSNAAGAGDA